MTRVDDGGDSAPTSKAATEPGQQFVKNENDLKIDVTDLKSYAMFLMTTQLNVLTGTKSAAGRIPGQLEAAVHPGQNGTNYEVAFAMYYAKCNMSETSQFLDALGSGLTNISNAAQTIADSYQGADAESSANINDVSFAFGDITATRPKGLASNIGQTELAYQYDQALKQGQASQAASADPSALATMQGVTPVSNPDGSTTYKFSDGSSITLTTSANDTHYSMDESTTAVVRDPKGNVISNTGTNTQAVQYSDKTVTQTERDPSTGKPTQTTATTTHADGSEDITITQHTADGDQTTTQHIDAPKSTPTSSSSNDPLDQQEKDTGGVYDGKYGYTPA